MMALQTSRSHDWPFLLRTARRYYLALSDTVLEMDMTFALFLVHFKNCLNAIDSFVFIIKVIINFLPLTVC